MITRPHTSAAGIVMRQVPWAYYIHTRDQLDSATRINFFRGSMEIFMSPISFVHDSEKTLVGDLVTLFAVARNIPITGIGSVTLMREELAVACEPDEAYYVRSTPPEPGTEDIDLTLHAAPDLVIEIEITTDAVAKEPIYAALGVAELWRWDRKTLRIRVLRPDGAGYDDADASGVLPTLPVDRLREHLAMRLSKPHHAVLASWLKSIAG